MVNLFVGFSSHCSTSRHALILNTLCANPDPIKPTGFLPLAAAEAEAARRRPVRMGAASPLQQRQARHRP